MELEQKSVESIAVGKHIFYIKSHTKIEMKFRETSTGGGQGGSYYSVTQMFGKSARTPNAHNVWGKLSLRLSEAEYPYRRVPTRTWWVEGPSLERAFVAPDNTTEGRKGGGVMLTN